MTPLKKQIIRHINLCSDMHKNYKHNSLSKLLNANQNLAPQGSTEWLAMREYNIGGSEMSVITGDNPYSSLETLIAQKIGLTKFEGNIATRWGKLFEQVTQMITESVFEIVGDTIRETGSLEGSVPHQRYSPDGLAVVKLRCAETINDEYMETEEYCIVLFEYKSPYGSIPSGTIPKHYLPQVKTGLCSIPLADFAIFINNLFRKCSFNNLDDTPVYDTNFHNKDSNKNFMAENPLALGMILFYQTKEQQQKFYELYESSLIESQSNEFDYSSDTDNDDPSNIFDNIQSESFKKPDAKKKYNIHSDVNEELCKYIYKFHSDTDIQIRDIGKSYYGDFDTILKLFDNNLLSVHYCEPHIFKKYETNIFLNAQSISCGNKNLTSTMNIYRALIKNRIINQESGSHNIVGYLPWKLLKSDIIYEPREKNYVKKYDNIIQKTIDIIKNINAHTSKVDRVNEFTKYFPKSKIPSELGMDASYNMEFLPKM